MFGNDEKDKTSFIYFLIVCLLSLVVMAETLVIVGKSVNPSAENKQEAKEEVIPSTPTVMPIPKSSLGTMSLELLNANQVKLVFNSPKIPVGGVDAILLFDPKVLKIDKITQAKEVFSQFVINTQQSAEGRIKITAYYPQKQLTGTQTVAVIDLKFLQNTSTRLSLEFDGSQRPADSNLVSQIDQQDILGQVLPLTVNPAK